MNDVTTFFREVQESFTVYVVEQRFAVGRGHDYFRSFKEKDNYISTNRNIKKQINKVIGWMQKAVPNVSSLIGICFPTSKAVGITDAIGAFSKLFSVQEHQAVGPEVLDPIIIQEGEILQKYLNQVIALHKNSILQPVIIILLKDNDFDRAKKLLSNCPHGINIKMIRNNGQSEIYKVINSGVDDIESFIEAFALQCFSTCSHTERNILLNKEWAENSVIRQYSPLMLKIKSHLIYDEKKVVQEDIDLLLGELITRKNDIAGQQQLLKSFECMARLFKVFCHDNGGKDLKIAYQLAKALDNDILLAHVYRYSHFFEGISRGEKQELLMTAQNIFSQNGIEDHAIYCKNNRLIHQFHSETIKAREFREMQQEALYNVPGLVGMSHIYNNTGVAHLLSGQPEEAINYFSKGLDYAKYEDRHLQKYALLCNRLIAKAYCYHRIEEDELRQVIKLIFDNLGIHSFPFIVSNYVMNIIAIAYERYPSLGHELMTTYPVNSLLQNAFSANVFMGTGPLARQLYYLENKHDSFSIKNRIQIPKSLSPVSGKRLSFIEEHGYSPFVFNIWL